MSKKPSCNMSHKESNIRFTIASLILFFSIYESSYALAVMALVIFYTALKRFCFIYALFNLNQKYSLKNYYLSLLPKHRNSPVFIFNEKGAILFRNEASHKDLLEITSLESLSIKNPKEVAAKNTQDTIFFENKSTSYQVEIKEIQEEQLILAYFTDVTELITLNKEIEEMQRDVICAMGEIGETRSKETGNHVKRVALYSYKLAILYGLSQEDAALLQMASPMHDIGKIGIADAILNAPRKLTSEEFEVMKTHASLGYDMLKHSKKPILKAAAIVAGEHHEKWDGSGYPNAKAGEEIHIFGRITAVADVFDALASDRVYKKAWEMKDILNLFEKEKGKHFEPKLVTLLMENLEHFLEIKEQFKDL
ncbi:HD domain-containing phosphohydrolase [Sulfurimonas crateris]